MSDDSDYDVEENPEGEIGIYEGKRNDLGERHGRGKSNFPNGDVYKGEYSEGKRNGAGIYRFRNARYEGEYVNGNRQGEGFMHYPDGSTYDGHWEDGDKSGIGTYTYPNGDTYEGEWKEDLKHGKGIYTYKSSDTQFKGHWVVGVREGTAEWFHKGHSYKGYFRNDHPFGRGRFIFDNGCEQHGYYKVTNLIEQVDKELTEVIGREARWTCTSLMKSSKKSSESTEEN